LPKVEIDDLRSSLEKEEGVGGVEDNLKPRASEKEVNRKRIGRRTVELFLTWKEMTFRALYKHDGTHFYNER
jgi:hypothetical protein